MAQVLKEEDIGVWLAGEPTGNYGHVIWANKVMRIAMGMGDSTGSLVEYALEGIPNLKAQSSPAFNTLPFQFSQLAMDNSRTAQPSYRASRAYANANTFMPPLPTANSLTTPITLASVAPNRPTRGIGSNAMGWRGNPFTCASLTRAQIMEKLNVLLQCQATDAGRRQYEADVDAWHRTYGTEGVPSLERPYLLRPGTAVVGLGECYTCGMITEPMHMSSQCTATETLRPQESRWRQYVAAMLRRATPAQPPAPAYTVAPIQYAPHSVHPYYQQYGAVPTPVFAVQDDQGWWDHSNAWGQHEVGYEWGSENYGGPLPTADQ
ncbi:hypothetical protein BDR06DRAFT_1013269 [Suillus hirtellus]|nr:hypothetical protein BDR06DRAFT_1013269 [Suillus hirtellus]